MVVFECALRWLESQGDTDPAHLLLVKKWRDLAANRRGEAKKQTTNTVHKHRMVHADKHSIFLYKNLQKEVYSITTLHILSYGHFLSYGHPLVPDRPDKGGSTVLQ